MHQIELHLNPRYERKVDLVPFIFWVEEIALAISSGVAESVLAQSRLGRQSESIFHSMSRYNRYFTTDPSWSVSCIVYLLQG